MLKRQIATTFKSPTSKFERTIQSVDGRHDLGFPDNPRAIQIRISETHASCQHEQLIAGREIADAASICSKRHATLPQNPREATRIPDDQEV